MIRFKHWNKLKCGKFNGNTHISNVQKPIKTHLEKNNIINNINKPQQNMVQKIINRNINWDISLKIMGGKTKRASSCN